MPKAIATNRENNIRPAPASPPVESMAQAAPVSRPGWTAREEAAWGDRLKVGGRAFMAFVRAWFDQRDEEAERVRLSLSAGGRMLLEIERLQRRAGELDPGGYLGEELRGLKRAAEAALAEAEG